MEKKKEKDNSFLSLILTNICIDGIKGLVLIHLGIFLFFFGEKEFRTTKTSHYRNVGIKYPAYPHKAGSLQKQE